MLRRILLTVVMAALLGTTTQLAHADTFPSAGGQWSAPGPYAVSVDVGAVTTLYYPRDIAQSTRRHPVIIWGNGTFAFPVVYRDLLIHWASHGFIVAAANTTQSNTGIQMRLGIDLLTSRNANPGSVFHNRVDLEHIGSSGHSQGGAAAIVTGDDPRVDTIIAIEPGPLANVDAVDGPALFLAGQYDSIVWPVLVRAFYNDADHIPAVYGELRGANHLTAAGNGGGFRGPATAWFRFHLMGDEEARGTFFGPSCGVCTDRRTWSDLRRNPLAEQF